MVRNMFRLGFVLAAFIAGCSIGRASKAEAADPAPMCQLCAAKTVKLDYTKSLVQMAKLNNFASAPANLKDFQAEKGAESVTLSAMVVRSEKMEELIRAMAALQKDGWRPATFAEMLAYERAMPKFSGPMLTWSRWHRDDGETFVPYIYVDHRGKHLSWRWLKTMPQTYLLVVAKK